MACAVALSRASWRIRVHPCARRSFDLRVVASLRYQQHLAHCGDVKLGGVGRDEHEFHRGRLARNAVVCSTGRCNRRHVARTRETRHHGTYRTTWTIGWIVGRLGNVGKRRRPTDDHEMTGPRKVGGPNHPQSLQQCQPSPAGSSSREPIQVYLKSALLPT